MDSPQELDKLRENSARWRDKQDPKAQRKPAFKTPSQMTVDQVYTPENTSQESYLEKQGLPGEYPLSAGRSCFRLSRAALDHAYVCRVRPA